MNQIQNYKYPLFKERYVLAPGIIVLLALAIYIWRLDMSPSKIWGIFFLLYIAVRNSGTLILNFLSAPDSLALENDSLKCAMPFGKTFTIDIKSIKSVRSIWWMDLVCNYNIVMDLEEMKRKRLYLKANLIGISDFLRELRRINPQIVLRGKSLLKKINNES